MRNSPIYYTRHYFGLILQNYLTTYHLDIPDDKLFITGRLDEAYSLYRELIKDGITNSVAYDLSVKVLFDAI